MKSISCFADLCHLFLSSPPPSPRSGHILKSDCTFRLISAKIDVTKTAACCALSAPSLFDAGDIGITRQPVERSCAMQNIRLTLQYDGTRYLGWQRPEKDGFHRSVSYKVNEILNRMTGEDILLHAGARTDPGVHALEQTASFHIRSPLNPEGFLRELNLYLPRDIAVLAAEKVPERFRADLNALSRTYEYRICTAEIYDVFRLRYEAHRFPAPDLPPMERAAAFLKGRHDFRCFSSGRKKKGTEKEILDIRFIQTADHITIRITANDFLHQMPSLIAGTLLEIGCGLRRAECVQNIFEGTEKAGPPAETKGLLLKSIQY